MKFAESADAAGPLSNQVHRRLRSDILHARLRPGELLSENLIADGMRVSRTPVREALHRLVREGLVRVLPQRGSQVALLSMQSIREALFVREAVESHVIRHLLSSPLDAAAHGRLADCIKQQATALAAQDTEAMMRCDEAFHRALLGLCGMQGIWPIVAQARDMHQRVRAIALPELHSGGQALRDHRAILKALRLNDVELATREMGSHLHRNEILTGQIAALHPDYFHRFEADANLAATTGSS